ncbi:Methyltransferase [Gracilaria domingensis]|nr:Methyltransferase [Gracilaria domingensis]
MSDEEAAQHDFKPWAPKIREVPKRVDGLDLKIAEQITRRILLHDVALPVYTLPPPHPSNFPRLTSFLEPNGFASIPQTVDPASRGLSHGPVPKYGVPPARADKKRAQIRYLVSVLSILVEAHPVRYPTIVDLCGGCGHVALVIATLFPDSSVHIVDENSTALSIASDRAKRAQLNNIQTHHVAVQKLSLSFDIALALHACGGASDAVISAAVRSNAALLVVPCCVGAIVSSRGKTTGAASCTNPVIDFCDRSEIDWHVPRSTVFRGLLEEGEYDCLAKAADFGEHGIDDWRKLSKALVEWDRLQWLRADHYQIRLTKMRPLSCTPKNDVLVAWPEKEGFKFTGDWLSDELANGFVRDVVDGSVLNGLGATEVMEVERSLRALVCDENSNGIYRSAIGAGKRRRKVVHAVAESLGLWHRSDGRGAQRTVVVSRSPYWPFFFDNYIGLGGATVEAICTAYLSKVPKSLVERRILVRGRPHHVTIISPTEVNLINSVYRDDPDMCLELVSRRLFGSSLLVLGLGRVQCSSTTNGLVAWDGNEAESEIRPSFSKQVRVAYYAVIKWPEAQRLRNEMGLPQKDFHITLGFTDKDIHNCRKDVNTLVHRDEREYTLTSIS